MAKIEDATVVRILVVEKALLEPKMTAMMSSMIKV